MSRAWSVAVRLASAGLSVIGMLASSRVLAQAAACAEEPLLSRAAAELLLTHQERPSADALTRAVRQAGSDAVGLHALFVPAWEPGSSERQWLATLRTRVDGELGCGRADAEAGRLLIAVGRGAELAPVDEQTRLVRGQLRPGFRDAELVIADADAQLVRAGVTPEDLQKGVVLAPELTAPIKVQLVARGPMGPRPVAERELPAAAMIDAESVSGTTTPLPDGHAAVSGAKELSELLLRLRTERGRASLRDNRLLREAASQHAHNVCAKGRVAHEVEAGAGPDARLAQAGLSARLLGEAIARAEDTRAALRALENSPSHLYTLLDPRFTDFGVGVARDSAQKYCYVVLLCAWPRYIGKSKP